MRFKISKREINKAVFPKFIRLQNLPFYKLFHGTCVAQNILDNAESERMNLKLTSHLSHKFAFLL